MRQLIQAYKGVVRGTSSGVAVSVLVHLGIVAVAASVMWVIPKEEPPRFQGYKAPERPKIDLIKPTVRIQQSSQPKRQTNLITIDRKAVDQPKYQVPDLPFSEDVPAMDLADRFGIEEMPETLIGDFISSGFGFEGTFYDLKRNRRGGAAIMDPHQYVAQVAKFVKSGWRTSTLSRYYRSPNKLYAESFMVPPVRSSVAPAAYGEGDTLGYCWLAHYNGQLAYHEDITFRFWGHGDDIMAVRVDGEEVLVACWPGSTWSPQEAITSAAGGWQSSDSKSRTYSLGNNSAVVGDWITLKAGQPVDMEVIIGEVPGGTFCSMLTVEVQGVDYELNRQQGPILPMFKTSEPSRDMKDRILEWMTLDHATLTGGPVFRDIVPKEQDVEPGQPLEVMEPVVAEETTARLWDVAGQLVEAEFMSVVGDKVVLKGARGKQVKVSLATLSSSDRDYIELAQPPEFNLSFTKQSSQRNIETTPFLDEVPPKILDYTFGAKMRQTSPREYNHEIKAELFVIGQQRIDSRKFILLDRLSSSFVPGSENDRPHVFKGDPVELMSYDTSQPMGKKYSDYLLILTDERGEVIQHSSSANWLFPNLENLRELNVGNFMDKTCTRVYPTGPGPKSLYN